MSKMEVTRRDLLKFGGLTAVGALGATALASCAPAASAGSGSGTAAASGSEGYPAFLQQPEPITEFADTREFDVVVVGAGESGLSAVHAALEAGASVACVQNINTVQTAGNMAAALDLDKTDEAGIKACISFINYKSDWRSNRDVVEVWARNSQEALAWWEEEAAKGGIESQPYDYSLTYNGYDFYLHANTYFHIEGAHQAAALVIGDALASRGAEFFFNTPCVQLYKEGDRVTGVIGNRTKGDPKGYVKFNAGKGVLLATGDYGNDPEMVKAFAPFCVDLPNTYFPASNTGGGHKMAMWAGASIDKPAHAPMIHFDPSPLPEGDAPLSGTPWLAVNKLGQRFQNEDTDYPYIVNQCILQPESTRFQITDANCSQHWNDFGGDFMRWTVSGDNQAEWDDALERGAIMKADSLEELADMMGVPKDDFLKTVERYNALVDKGEDEDFGKNPDYLKISKIEKAPFYAIKRVPGVLTILGGLHVNQNLQVLDLEEQPIEGLYAAGNVSGNFFGNDYPLWLGAASCGRAVTFGRYAAKSMLG